jgi:hypothetical protein
MILILRLPVLSWFPSLVVPRRITHCPLLFMHAFVHASSDPHVYASSSSSSSSSCFFFGDV